MERLGAVEVVASESNNVLQDVSLNKEISLEVLQCQKSNEVGSLLEVVVELETNVVHILSLDVEGVLEFLLVVKVVNEINL